MKKQQGIALITILVMVALATILAATIVKYQTNTRENTDYLKRQSQALLYAKSAESFFQEILIDDAKNAGEVDHLNETWAKPIPTFPIDGGTITGVLEDESGKFNLNRLLKEDGSVNESAKAWFEKLLIRVGLQAQLVEAVIDWQDANDEPVGSMGAESSYYAGFKGRNLPSNQKFFNVEELRQVRGFEGDAYDLIEPYITAQPKTETAVNVNTASGFLIASMHPQLDALAIQSELDRRKQNLQYFKNVDDLWSLDSMRGIDNETKKAVTPLLGVKSNFFKAKIEVFLHERKRQFTSYFVRDNQKIYIHHRSLSPFLPLVISKSLD